jgi:hypothetical protein
VKREKKGGKEKKKEGKSREKKKTSNMIYIRFLVVFHN